MVAGFEMVWFTFDTVVGYGLVQYLMKVDIVGCNIVDGFGADSSRHSNVLYVILRSDVGVRNRTVRSPRSTVLKPHKASIV